MNFANKSKYSEYEIDSVRMLLAIFKPAKKGNSKVKAKQTLKNSFRILFDRNLSMK